MQAKTIVGATLAALGGLALIGVIAANPFSTQASSVDTPGAAQTQPVSQSRSDTITPSQVGQPEAMRSLQATDADEDEKTKPYLGIVIFPLEDGSIKVVKVLDDGPSDGVLQTGDVITAAGGETVDEVSDLTGAIQDAGADATLTLTITRDGNSQNVEVTIGEMEIDDDALMPGKGKRFSFHKGFGAALGSLRDRIARAEIVVADEDGNYQTHRTVVGTATSIDADAGTFTLEPKDGSDSIDYTIDDETKVSMNRAGDIGSLNSSDETLVMDIDGKVALVRQGGMMSPNRSIGPRLWGEHNRPRGQLGGRPGFYSGPGSFDAERMIEEILERLEMEEFSGFDDDQMRHWFRMRTPNSSGAYTPPAPSLTGGDIAKSPPLP